MEDGGDTRTTSRSIDTNTSNNVFTARDRSTSAPSTRTGSGHRRSLSGSLFSRLSFLRMNQATHVSPPLNSDGDDLPSTLSSGRAMSSALQQQRRTRRRRGSLRKTALLGTRLEKKARALSTGQRMSLVAQENEPTPRGSHDGRCGGDGDNRPEWAIMTAQKQPLEPRPTSSVARENLFDGEDATTDDDDELSFSPLTSTTTTNTTNNNNSSNESTEPTIHTSSSSAANLAHMTTPSSSTDSYYALHHQPPDYRTVHHSKSPLATHASEIPSPQEITWNYAETEWWGWIILIVTWLVFVVGMGSCFEVWSWAWDVGETPYAPPELEDDPTLPIVGYYPALIILTAVMSWVWVIIAWVGMKYFKHANISGEDI